MTVNRMFLNYKFIIVASLLMAFGACKKHHDCPQPEKEKPEDYFPLKKGNYWIYEEIQIDTNGVETLLPYIDSFYVAGDTLINGKKYWTMIEDNSNPNFYDAKRFYRFTDDKIFDSDSFLTFSSTEYNKVLHQSVVILGNNDTMYWATSQMTDIDKPFTVKAGTFNTMNFKTTYNPRFRICFKSSLFLEVSSLFAKSVGNIYHRAQIYCGDEKIIYRKLLRYHVN